MSEIKFVEFNGIKEYARVMYNDVKDADKHRIDVAYNGKDIKDLLEYLFEIETLLQQKENIIKEVRKWANKTIFYFDFEEEITKHAFDLLYTKQGKELLEILDKEKE